LLRLKESNWVQDRAAGLEKYTVKKMGNLEGIGCKIIKTNQFLIYDKLFAQFLIYIRKPLLTDDFATDPF
jgi:hypothetical protein